MVLPGEKLLFLYPRLSQTHANDLAAILGDLDVDIARSRSRPTHEGTVYAPSGGHRVSEERLTEIANGVRSIAARSGYPGRPTKDADEGLRAFDVETATFLHSRMEIGAAEASAAGVWSFIGCVLLPDIARWRYPGREGFTPRERFLGAARGTRNVLGRLWWRAELLGTDNDEQGDSLLSFLSEDELVAVMERPGLAGNPILARQIGKSFRQVVGQSSELRRTDIMRDATKRVRRLLTLISFESLDEGQVGEIVGGVFVQSVRALREKAGA